MLTLLHPERLTCLSHDRGGFSVLQEENNEREKERSHDAVNNQSVLRLTYRYGVL